MTRGGFTLIELMTSAMIAVVLLLAVGSATARGLDAVAVLDPSNNAPVADALISMEKFSKEIQTSPVYPDVAFEGKRDRVSFPRIVPISGGEKTLSNFQLGQVQTGSIGGGKPAAAVCEKVEFFYDPLKKAVMRQEGKQTPEVFITGVKEADFGYAFLNEEGGLAWEENTPEAGSDAVLAAMNVRLELDGKRGSARLVERVIPLIRLHPVNALKYQKENVQA